MSGLLKLSMIIALVLSFKGLHMLGTAIVDHYGLLGALAACAVFYCASVVIDR